MLHLLADSAPEPRPQPYAEAVARLASVRYALRLVDPFGGGPASDPCDQEVAESWADAGAARRHCFERRSERLVGATAAGVEALLSERQSGREPHAEAAQELVEQIRRELAEVARAVLA